MVDYFSIVLSIALGTLGGFVHVLMDAKSWSDVTKFSSCRQILISMAIGFLYMYLHSDYNFPNTVMTFISGYAGTDFIKALLEKREKKE